MPLSQQSIATNVKTMMELLLADDRSKKQNPQELEDLVTRIFQVSNKEDDFDFFTDEEARLKLKNRIFLFVEQTYNYSTAHHIEDAVKFLYETNSDLLGSLTPPKAEQPIPAPPPQAKTPLQALMASGVQGDIPPIHLRENRTSTLVTEDLGRILPESTRNVAVLGTMTYGASGAYDRGNLSQEQWERYATLQNAHLGQAEATIEGVQLALKDVRIKLIVIPVGPGHYRSLFLKKPVAGPFAKYELEIFDPMGVGMLPPQFTADMEVFIQTCGLPKHKFEIVTPPPIMKQSDYYSCGDFVIADIMAKMQQYGCQLSPRNQQIVTTYREKGNLEGALREQIIEASREAVAGPKQSVSVHQPSQSKEPPTTPKSVNIHLTPQSQEPATPPKSVTTHLPPQSQEPATPPKSATTHLPPQSQEPATPPKSVTTHLPPQRQEPATPPKLQIDTSFRKHREAELLNRNKAYMMHIWDEAFKQNQVLGPSNIDLVLSELVFAASNMEIDFEQSSQAAQEYLRKAIHNLIREPQNSVAQPTVRAFAILDEYFLAEDPGLHRGPA